MNHCLTNPYIESHPLQLRDGNNWCIVCDEHNIRMINKLTAIMQLKKCKLNGSAKLIFLKMEEDKKLAIKTIFSEQNLLSYDLGWKCYDFSSRTIRVWCHSNIGDVLCEVNNKGQDNIEYINMWYSLQPIYRRSVSLGGVPFHAGLAEINGRGVLFVASGGIGKSTCCRRLPDYWKPLCDDETLVVLDNQNEYRAHPFPTWSDYLMNRAHNTWDIQYSVPVSAIFFLEQADNDEVVPLAVGEASVLIAESASQVCVYSKTLLRNREDLIEFRKKLFDNAFNMAMSIPTFHLRVCLDGKFWEEVEKVVS